MVTGFERIIISVPEIGEAADEYRSLMGVEPFPAELSDAGKVLWFDLGNTVVQLQRGSIGEAAITGIVFSVPGGEGDSGPVANQKGLDLHLSDGAALVPFRREQSQVPGLRVDHLVLRTADAQGCIDLFGGRLGIRLALDKTVPEWGGRMLFFRTGQLTLEIIASDEIGQDVFWGIAYQCGDIELTAKRLLASGVALSEIRDGRKPGTRVATVKSHCLGLPTLLIEAAT